ncbi:DUF7310 family coiled-coil domain-containing protein [Halorarius halobius]|uniref:DUF7310 family coiled-coil domain-containing protein n=1 Tax=Halorarius halobius TaxID=2962671 RepID=UPI0020CBF013|nr:hypothetical protein [Halorarius halobius]
MSLDERLAAVERALTDGDVEPAALSDAATVERRLDAVERRQADLETRIADLEAAVDALRGRAGEDDHDHREAERTAERALATARETRKRFDDADRSERGHHGPTAPAPSEPRESDDEEADGLLAWMRERW